MCEWKRERERKESDEKEKYGENGKLPFFFRLELGFQVR